MGRVPAVGIAEHDYIGTRFKRRFERAQRKLGRGFICVKKMGRVVDDVTALRFDERDRRTDALEVLFFGDFEVAIDARVPAFAEQRHHRGPEVEQRTYG